MNIPRQLFTRKPVFCPPAVFRWDRLPVGWLVILLLFPCFAHAAQVNLLNTTSITATGSGATGTPSISSFTIPAGKNRTLFIFAAFERDHCDQPGDICGPTNTTGAGLGDNYAGPIATGGSQITARVTGSGGTIDRKNASGGAPVGDLPLGGLYAQIGGMTAYSLESYPVTLKETELETLLGGAASGAVSITLPDVFAPKNTGDDAILMAFVFSNTDQTASGVVRSAIPYRIVAGAGMAGDYTLTASSFDAGQAPNDANDGLLVVGLSSLGLPDSYGGFQTMSGYSVLQSVLTNNAAGRYDNEEPTWVTTEPDGFSASAQFRNGIASTFSMTSAGAASLKMLAAMAPAFTLSSDNADTSDAPASYGSPTHAISGIRLGASVDADADILASYTATGDDTSGSDDEDGVTLPASLNLGQSYSIPVSIQSAAGYLNAWFDWNRDGDFLDAGEQVATNQPVSTGTSNLSITVPVTAEPRNTFARFRVCSSSGACQTPSGVAASGEVEDYLVSIAPKPVVPIPSTTCGNLLSGEFEGTFGTLASGIRDLQEPAMGGYI
ncbi:MAG: hypothetical protein KDI15_13385, partial [Thiothrix sp.]|nr:hypothetical protein [Thiothrix sp.]